MELDVDIINIKTLAKLIDISYSALYNHLGSYRFAKFETRIIKGVIEYYYTLDFLKELRKFYLPKTVEGRSTDLYKKVVRKIDKLIKTWNKE